MGEQSQYETLTSSSVQKGLQAIKGNPTTTAILRVDASKLHFGMSR